MADWLLIKLASRPGASATWLVADAAGRLVVPAEHGPLARAAALAPSRRVCVVVPAEEVIHTEADVPARAGARAQQIVPFALEEQLAEDIEHLHFAVGRRPGPTARTPVAVVAKASMNDWLAALHSAGLHPEALYALSDLMPANPGQAVALLEADSVIVRPVGRWPVTLPIDALADALKLALPTAASSSGATRTGQGLLLYTGAAEWQRHSPTVEALRDQFDGIKVQLLTDSSLDLLAPQLPTAHAAAINLLQGPYASKSSFVTDWRLWRIAAVLLLGLVTLHAAGSALELVAIHRAQRNVEAAVIRTFRRAMPGERDPIEARRRMEQRLASLGRTGRSGLLPALGALASAHPFAADTILRTLEFREGKLELTVTAPSPAQIEHLTRHLQAAGWRAELTAGRTVGSHYEGHVEIKSGS